MSTNIISRYNDSWRLKTGFACECPSVSKPARSHHQERRPQSLSGAMAANKCGHRMRARYREACHSQRASEIKHAVSHAPFYRRRCSSRNYVSKCAIRSCEIVAGLALRRHTMLAFDQCERWSTRLIRDSGKTTARRSQALAQRIYRRSRRR